MTASSASCGESWSEATRHGPAGGVMALAVGHDAAMIGAARRAVGSWLHERGCRTGDDALLVLSELVTNAIVHTAAGCTIEVRHGDDLLLLGVRDRSAQAPVLKRVDSSDVSGRGLHIVDAVADEWGWEPTPGGKRVWAVVRAAVHDPGGDSRTPAAIAGR